MTVMVANGTLVPYPSLWLPQFGPGAKLATLNMGVRYEHTGMLQFKAPLQRLGHVAPHLWRLPYTSHGATLYAVRGGPSVYS